MSESIVVEVQDRVAWIRLNRPESLNALTPTMGRELLAAVERLGHDRSVRVLVLAGTGSGFCSGADLREIAAQELGTGVDLGATLRDIFHPLILQLRTLEKPIIAAVQGGAVGLGCALALAADLVVAGAASYLLMAFTNIGLTLDGGSSALLTGRAGYGRAAEMSLLAERVDANRAHDWGLVNQVVADEQLQAAAGAIAARLAAGPPGAYAATKRALNQAAFPRLREQLELEVALQQERAMSADFKEGVQAFLEKRPPQFTGD